MNYPECLTIAKVAIGTIRRLSIWAHGITCESTTVSVVTETSSQFVQNKGELYKSSSLNLEERLGENSLLGL